eukprot:CAMPEP_0170369848 /NCGR_PEP_ID=MMETSP0117_2-20130122/8201_1 /TAXON_ID=400756 /ORGANISM="Durinskia baltica, Strain CSIRO CS-38" /LENGTH=98 /DNA_ID=CAMNT_0010624593 /DNA_START=251 /DNA_END=544 /DNA_ORIENTATION=+
MLGRKHIDVPSTRASFSFAASFSDRPAQSRSWKGACRSTRARKCRAASAISRSAKVAVSSEALPNSEQVATTLRVHSSDARPSSSPAADTRASAPAAL